MPNSRKPTPPFFSTWKEDLLASVVVFLVALPLSLGLALVAGYPFERAAAVGLISGVVGGIVVGLLSGVPLQVTGAANGAAVTVAVFVKEFGFETLGVIIILAGVIQLAAGVFRFGPVFRAVSPALVQGMLAGIGLLIFASQFHVMVDDMPPGAGKEFGGLINIWSLPDAILKGLSEEAHRPATRVGLLTITTIVLWNAYAPQRLKAMPAALIGVGLSTLLVTWFGWDMKTVPAPDNLLHAVQLPQLSAVESLADSRIWMAALSLAFVAGAESLLTATAVDAMQTHTARAQYNRELVAQGVGNMICGALGVLPVSGVIVRSGANVLAGGRTRLATILHGVWILLSILLLPDLLKLIPVASLAAVLVYAGAKLIKLSFLRGLWRTDRAEVGVYIATMATVVATDVLTGIAVGVVLAVLRLLYTFSHLDIQVETDAVTGGTTVFLDGAATFIRLPQLATTLEQLPADAHVHVRLDRLTFIDHAALDLMDNWAKQHQDAGGTLTLDWSTLHGLFKETAWAPSAQGRKPQPAATLPAPLAPVTAPRAKAA